MSSDWDAEAHVKFLREQGGPSSGYTADLLLRVHQQRCELIMVLTAITDANAESKTGVMSWARALVKEVNKDIPQQSEKAYNRC